MDYILSNCSIRYTNHFVFDNLSTQFIGPSIYAITGSNGSGKSSLLRALSGQSSLFSGNISLVDRGLELERENWYQHIAFCAPYIELIEEFTIAELLSFHGLLRKMKQVDFYEELQMNNIKGKSIQAMSSGMKQKLKLCLCFLTQAPILLIDEPCTNLDASSKAWFQEMLLTHSQNRLVIIASNQQEEYQQAQNILEISKYKN